MSVILHKVMIQYCYDAVQMVGMKEMPTTGGLSVVPHV
jgi:hypothetical protein